MAEDHGAPGSRATLQTWTRGRRDRQSPKSEQRRVHSWTVKNEIKGGLGRVSAGAARRILDSAYPEEMRA